MFKYTALYNAHAKEKAKFINFAGWQMPIHYGSQVDEHTMVRRNVGMFDVSHMRVSDIIGQDAVPYARKILSNDILKLDSFGKAMYCCLLNDDGGIIDDVIAYYIDDRHVRIVSNAGTADKVHDWLASHSKNFEVSFTLHNEFGIIAVQGPNSVSLVANLFEDSTQKAELFGLKKFEFKVFDDIFFARTGYTGEDGFEIIMPVFEIESMWNKLKESGVHPIGLGARDSLRLEAGFNLYGEDMDDSVTPYECGLGWTVSISNDRDFLGKEKLLERKENIRFKRVGLFTREKGKILRAGAKVLLDNKEVGTITSGTFAPTVFASIGLARIDSEHCDSDEFQVDIRGNLATVKKTKFPFTG